MSSYIIRYECTRWRIYFGKYEGVERFAINELQKVVQRQSVWTDRLPQPVLLKMESSSKPFSPLWRCSPRCCGTPQDRTPSYSGWL